MHGVNKGVVSVHNDPYGDLFKELRHSYAEGVGVRGGAGLTQHTVIHGHDFAGVVQRGDGRERERSAAFSPPFRFS